jgi:ABC-type Fe3+/spermidine/putrescine transport system ATPase subunit
MTLPTTLLELRNVRKAFREREVLRGINMGLEENQNLVLTGPSGSGKSTLLRLIAGLEAPSEGEVFIAGRLVSRGRTIIAPPRERGIAMVFQDLGLWPNLTALGNVLLGLSGLRLRRKERRERARAALADCQIEGVSEEYPHRLSVGEQQRVALARAMAVQPRLLLLDEPFTALDIVVKELLLDQIAQLTSKLNTRVFLVSHFPPDAAAVNGTLAVLEDGVICEQGQLDEMLRQPGSRTLMAWQRRLLEKR